MNWIVLIRIGYPKTVGFSKLGTPKALVSQLVRFAITPLFLVPIFFFGFCLIVRPLSSTLVPGATAPKSPEQNIIVEIDCIMTYDADSPWYVTCINMYKLWCNMVWTYSLWPVVRDQSFIGVLHYLQVWNSRLASPVTEQIFSPRVAIWVLGRAAGDGFDHGKPWGKPKPKNGIFTPLPHQNCHSLMFLAFLGKPQCHMVV